MQTFDHSSFENGMLDSWSDFGPSYRSLESTASSLTPAVLAGADLLLPSAISVSCRVLTFLDTSSSASSSQHVYVPLHLQPSVDHHQQAHAPLRLSVSCRCCKSWTGVGLTWAAAEVSEEQVSDQWVAEVQTSAFSGAGTSAHVHMILHGQYGSSGRIPLETAGSLQRGANDLFALPPGVEQLGNLIKLTLGHDNRVISATAHSTPPMSSMHQVVHRQTHGLQPDQADQTASGGPSQSATAILPPAGLGMTCQTHEVMPITASCSISWP